MHTYKQVKRSTIEPEAAGLRVLGGFLNVRDWISAKNSETCVKKPKVIK